jgi:hypothetical protein
VEDRIMAKDAACALVINSNSSANFVNLLFKTTENILLIHEFSVTPLCELGSDFDPLFLKIGTENLNNNNFDDGNIDIDSDVNNLQRWIIYLILLLRLRK